VNLTIYTELRGQKIIFLFIFRNSKSPLHHSATLNSECLCVTFAHSDERLCVCVCLCLYSCIFLPVLGPDFVCVCLSVREYVRTYVHACVHACMRACVIVCS